MKMGLLAERPQSAPLGGVARRRCVAIGIFLVAISVFASGCVVTPRHSPNSAVPPPPQIPEGAAGAQVAAEIRSATPKTDFHADATDRQAFQVHIDIGRVYESQGNFDAASLEYQEALTVVESKKRGSLHASDAAVAHRRIAGACDRLGRFAQAEVHYQKALRLSPKDPKIWNDSGYSYYLQGRWADAERALKMAAKLAAEDERIRTNLGLALAAAGKTQEAFPLFSQSNGDANAHANIGYMLAATGQYGLARRQYETALALRPDMELAHRALARLDRQQQQQTDGRDAPGLMAEGTRSTGQLVDSHVNPAAADAGKIPAPRPWTVLPGAHRTGPQNVPGGPVATELDDVDLSTLPPPPPL